MTVRSLFLSLIATGFWNAGSSAVVYAQLEFEQPPINYYETAPVDPVAKLQKQIDHGGKLEYDPQHNYLPAVLKALDIPQSSQMLVFSKTSLQLHRISASRPRALYFNDDSYVGSVQNGDVLEISTVDPHLGAVFYTLSTDEVKRPQFVRDQGQCMTCHASSRTQDVPGHLMRSVFAGRDGQPHFGSGTYTTTQASPFQKRWGGWYVTGTHGDIRHMGNIVTEENVRLQDLDVETGANLTDLSPLIDTTPYLRDTSDIVALLVLGHQLQMHNLFTRGNYETRHALHYNAVMNKALERPDDFLSESTERRVSSVSEKIVKCLLFADEVPLTSRVQGNSTYQHDFQAKAIRDSQGRSLRDFDLRTRLFKYPCSYLIYSDAFDSLPPLVKDKVTARLLEILHSDRDLEDFPNLTRGLREDILEILQETKPSLFASASQADGN